MSVLESQPMITLCIRSGTTMGPLAACPLSAARTEAVSLPADRAGETPAPSVMSEGVPAGGVLAVAAAVGPPAGGDPAGGLELVGGHVDGGRFTGG